MTIDINLSSESESESTCDEDEDYDLYEPSFDISLCPNNALNLRETSFVEEEFEIEAENDDPSSQIEEDIEGVEVESPYVKHIDIMEESDFLIKDETCIVYLNCLKTLAEIKINKSCTRKSCSSPVDLHSKFVGSAVYFKWICTNGHLNNKWCSLPILKNKLHGGDLLMSTALLASGNNYAKIALLAKFLKLHILNVNTYYRIQRKYLVPAVTELWEDTQKEILTAHEGKDVVLLGDGRMDSPGHSAQFCTYTMMDNADKSILSIMTIDKRETEGKSTLMEKVGFQKSVSFLKQQNVNVVECVTDAHLQIGALMKNEYPDIKHSHNIWHAAKNLAKALVAAGQKKDCKVLLSWSKDIVNHFWHTCETSKTYDEFLGIWCGILHHVVDEHQWALSYSDVGTASCSHGPLESERQKGWMTKGHPAHNALRKIVLNNRFLKKIPYWLNFRGTAELENFHQCILMYAAKRFHYSPPMYKVRNLLAALDYTANHQREIKKNKDGTTRYQRLFNKKSKRWTVVPVKEEKDYSYIQKLVEMVVYRRLLDETSLKTVTGLGEDDPRRLSRNIASVPAPPTHQLVEEKLSRFKKKL
ncbi:uncharacterized protein [Antedon mediterranea]|uniref:uncharacterized protein n=1 Tax=Antedon mediterranea TaxID=105859 RepID=UPI003AF9AEA4